MKEREEKLSGRNSLAKYCDVWVTACDVSATDFLIHLLRNVVKQQRVLMSKVQQIVEEMQHHF
ncbi:hypothetical protein CIG19_01200 [Enterobacterales bacterium CwR94]|nr:hypothetical protein CIG19_01200 [Enterobacterales bacterium CwR94]